MEKKQSVLVTGGAGYIGSHVCKELKAAGYNPVTFDNLSAGNIESVKYGPFVKGDIRNIDQLIKAIEMYSIGSVIHLAAYIAAGESVLKPAKYYYNNSFGGLNVIEAMVATKVDTIVFSSTAAIYGVPRTDKIKEDHPKNPINPYGASKLFVERMLEDFSISHGIKSASLRYFNAAGADFDGQIGCDHEIPNNLIPIIMNVLTGDRKQLEVFGTDYDTKDGTGVRDYIHVVDLAKAHVLALEHLFLKGENLALNLGTGSGYSVREVIDMSEKIAGKKLKVVDSPRREGDPAILIADSTKAYKKLTWRPENSDLEKIVESAWNWQQIRKNNN